MRWVVIWGALVKAFGHTFYQDAPVAGVFWLASAILAIRYERFGSLVVAVTAAAVHAAGVPQTSNHVLAFAWVAVAIALFPPGDDRREAFRSIAVAVYLFAGLNKVLFGSLDGHIIPTIAPTWPEWSWAPLATGGAVLELWLAVAVWRSWRSALPAAIVLHIGILAWSHVATLSDFLIASLFQLTLVALVAVTTRGVGDGASARLAELEPEEGRVVGEIVRA